MRTPIAFIAVVVVMTTLRGSPMSPNTSGATPPAASITLGFVSFFRLRKKMSKEKTNIEKLDEQDAYRVHRSGSWYFNAWRTRVSARNGDIAPRRDRNFGFRLILQTKEKK